ncbi:MAG: sigma-70 family RNA polymerase sigma factor [Verrucomicrobiaceae bacterium]|nr:sigma-70 family RNA polymerase sigma factor [Verrucomicrobiaceae bacterium]
MKATLDDSPIGQHDECARLFVLATLGDEAAASDLYSRCVPSLRAWLAARIGWTQAEDIAHDALIRVFHRSDRFRAGSAFAPWLKTIAWNLAQKAMRDDSRRLARERAYFDEESFHAPDVSAKEERRRAALAECLAALPARQFQLVHSRFFEGRSADQIAREQGRTRVAIAVNLHRVCRGLRVDMERLAPSRHAVCS